MLLKGWMLLGEAISPASLRSPSSMNEAGAAAPDTQGLWTAGSWVVEDGRLREASETEAARSADLTGWFTPGFVDSHCHVGIGPDGPVDAAARREQITADLRTGVLTVRDCGVPVDNSELSGAPGMPTLIRCGQHVARTKRYLRGLPRDVEPSKLPEALAEEAARGDGWVKIVADWIDRSRGADSDLDPLWPREALVDAVAAAHEAGARVIAHCFSHGAIDDLLEAGVDDIEHASGMDADQMAQARAQGTLVTPTLRQVDLFGDFAAAAGTKYPVYGATMRAMYERRREHAAALFDSGITLLPGTDSGGYQEHGILGDELRSWVEVGVPAARALEMATRGARAALGLTPLDVGEVADLVHFGVDPSVEPSVWGRPDTVLVAGVPAACADAGGPAAHPDLGRR